MVAEEMKKFGFPVAIPRLWLPRLNSNCFEGAASNVVQVSTKLSPSTGFLLLIDNVGADSVTGDDSK